MKKSAAGRIGAIVIVGSAALGLLRGWIASAADGPPKGPHGESRVAVEINIAVEIKLPKPLFQGTPKNIKQAPTLEQYNEEARPLLFAPEGTTNLALRKKVTSSDAQPIIGELSMITDGDKESSDGSFVELGPEKQWVQVDLGAADIYAVVVWHYHGEARVYHDVVVQAADDPDFVQNVKTIFNNDFDNSSGFGVGKQLEYIDDYRGKLINARNEKGEPVRASYVRLYCNGNTSNDLNHYVEVEVYGKAAQ